ncbi:hypothetical protein RhiirA4_474727 [Rhizophagus irregularis]|uniref:Uncharacterized protein n=1 Tax=Rhizophagus irregularis TaxID=588596 RepID=A0A2I1H918_9GLOM|nr:hypothetical protein RhiirA4_474727 [Rhizophagus irregularis]
MPSVFSTVGLIVEVDTTPLSPSDNNSAFTRGIIAFDQKSNKTSHKLQVNFGLKLNFIHKFINLFLCN